MSSKRSTCPKGTIERRGYTAKRGGKTIRVRSSCIHATSASGKKRSPMDLAKIAERERIHRKISKKYGSIRCPPGTIERVGFTRSATKRRAYTRRDGTRVRATTVHASETGPTCVSDRGLPGKGTFRIPTVLERGDLKKYGYSNVKSLPRSERHSILREIIRDIRNPLSLFRKLNILATYNRNQDPSASKIFKDDATWVRENYVRSIRSGRSKKSGSKRTSSGRSRTRSRSRSSTRRIY